MTPAELGRLSLSRWRMAMTGAEPIREATLSAFDERFGPCGWQSSAWACVYGLAENTLYAAGRAELPCILPLDRRRLGIGQCPLPPEVKASSGGEGGTGGGSGDGNGSSSGSGGGSGRGGDDSGGGDCDGSDSDGGSTPSVLYCAGCFLLPSTTGQELTIVHPDSGTALADDTVGEVWLRGPCLGRGYWGCAEASSATFAATLTQSPQLVQPYLRTGDLGLIHEKRLYLVGRLKDVLTLRGRTLHASDVEECIERRHSDVLRAGCCAAVAVEDVHEEGLVLLMELKAEATRPKGPLSSAVQLASLLGDLRKLLASLMGVRPKHMLLLSPHTLPKTTSGKLRRIECRQLYMHFVARREAADRSDCTLGRSLVHSWQWQDARPGSCAGEREASAQGGGSEEGEEGEGEAEEDAGLSAGDVLLELGQVSEGSVQKEGGAQVDGAEEGVVGEVDGRREVAAVGVPMVSDDPGLPELSVQTICKVCPKQS